MLLMAQRHSFFTGKVRMGNKGQITIPKKIRDEDKLADNDLFIVTHMAGGDIVLRKKTIQTPEDLMLEAIREAPPINADEAWEEVKRERRMERS